MGWGGRRDCGHWSRKATGACARHCAVLHTHVCCTWEASPRTHRWVVAGGGGLLLGQRQAGPEGGLAAVHAHSLCRLRRRWRRQGGQHQPERQQGSLRGGEHGSRHERQGSGGCTRRRSSRRGKRRRGGGPSTHQGGGPCLHTCGLRMLRCSFCACLQGRAACGPQGAVAECASRGLGGLRSWARKLPTGGGPQAMRSMGTGPRAAGCWQLCVPAAAQPPSRGSNDCRVQVGAAASGDCAPPCAGGATSSSPCPGVCAAVRWRPADELPPRLLGDRASPPQPTKSPFLTSCLMSTAENQRDW